MLLWAIGLSTFITLGTIYWPRLIPCQKQQFVHLFLGLNLCIHIDIFFVYIWLWFGALSEITCLVLRFVLDVVYIWYELRASHTIVQSNTHTSDVCIFHIFYAIAFIKVFLSVTLANIPLQRMNIEKKKENKTKTHKIERKKYVEKIECKHTKSVSCKWATPNKHTRIR